MKDLDLCTLYRPRSYDQLKRKVSKLVEGMTWFKNVQIYDKFRNRWKSSVNYKHDRGGGRRMGRDRCLDRTSTDTKSPVNEKEIVTAMFVPASPKSLLLKNIMKAEEDISPDMDWNIKIV